MAAAIHQTQPPVVTAIADVLRALSRLHAMQVPGLEQCMAVSVDVDRLVEETKAAVARHTTNDASPPASG